MAAYTQRCTRAWRASRTTGKSNGLHFYGSGPSGRSRHLPGANREVLACFYCCVPSYTYARAKIFRGLDAHSSYTMFDDDRITCGLKLVPSLPASHIFQHVRRQFLYDQTSDSAFERCLGVVGSNLRRVPSPRRAQCIRENPVYPFTRGIVISFL